MRRLLACAVLVVLATGVLVAVRSETRAGSTKTALTPATALAPVVSPPPTSPTTSITTSASGGFRYSAVMLLPLVFLIAIGWVCRLLLTDATPHRRTRA